MQIKFDGVKGYATFERAVKRGEEVETMVQGHLSLKDSWKARWLVVAKPDGRFVPAFHCGDIPGGPGLFLGLTNVCCFN